LNALRIESPASRDGYVLLAIDFKGRGNANPTAGEFLSGTNCSGRFGYVTPFAMYNAYRYQGEPMYWLGR
jgi:hypothetical protein